MKYKRNYELNLMAMHITRYFRKLDYANRQYIYELKYEYWRKGVGGATVLR